MISDALFVESFYKFLPPPVYSLLLGWLISMPTRKRRKRRFHKLQKWRRRRCVEKGGSARGGSASNWSTLAGPTLVAAARTPTQNPHRDVERETWSFPSLEGWKPWMVGFRMLWSSWTTGEAPERLHHFKEVGRYGGGRMSPMRGPTKNKGPVRKSRECDAKKPLRMAFWGLQKSFKPCERVFLGGGETRKMNRLLEEAS